MKNAKSTTRPRPPVRRQRPTLPTTKAATAPLAVSARAGTPPAPRPPPAARRSPHWITLERACASSASTRSVGRVTSGDDVDAEATASRPLRAVIGPMQATVFPCAASPRARRLRADHESADGAGARKRQDVGALDLLPRIAGSSIERRFVRRRRPWAPVRRRRAFAEGCRARLGRGKPGSVAVRAASISARAASSLMNSSGTMSARTP